MKIMVSNNSEKQNGGQINHQMNIKEWGLLLFFVSKGSECPVYQKSGLVF
jgi:hypothetical protein